MSSRIGCPSHMNNYENADDRSWTSRRIVVISDLSVRRDRQRDTSSSESQSLGPKSLEVLTGFHPLVLQLLSSRQKQPSPGAAQKQQGKNHPHGKSLHPWRLNNLLLWTLHLCLLWQTPFLWDKLSVINWKQTSIAHSISSSGAMATFPCLVSLQLFHKDHMPQRIMTRSLSEQQESSRRSTVQVYGHNFGSLMPVISNSFVQKRRAKVQSAAQYADSKDWLWMVKSHALLSTKRLWTFTAHSLRQKGLLFPAECEVKIPFLGLFLRQSTIGWAHRVQTTDHGVHPPMPTSHLVPFPAEYAEPAEGQVPL